MDGARRLLLAVLFGIALLEVQSFLSLTVLRPPYTPMLLLPLVVYYGLLSEVNVVRGMLVAFSCGYLADLFSGHGMSLNTFVLGASFLVARGLGARLFLRNVALRSAAAFVASTAAMAGGFALRELFEKRSPIPLTDSSGLTRAIVVSSLTTALFAPLVYSVVVRIEVAENARREEGGVAG